MVEYGTTKAGKDDAISNVQGEIDNVRGIMTQNIESLLERGERIDLLVDKTDRLGGSAQEFRVRSRGLRRQMWYVLQLLIFERHALLTDWTGGRTSNLWLS
jgi:vesicle-associated membrane protein 7